MPSAKYVATGTVRRAFFASSASTGACSNPTNPSTATTASTPIVPDPAEVSAPRDKAAKLRWPPAGCTSPATVSAADHSDLRAQQDSQHPAGDVDPAQAQHGDHRPGAQRPRPPRRVQ